MRRRSALAVGPSSPPPRRRPPPSSAHEHALERVGKCESSPRRRPCPRRRVRGDRGGGQRPHRPSDARRWGRPVRGCLAAGVGARRLRSGALAPLYPGSVRRYRLRFAGPRTPPAFAWRPRFEECPQREVFLNGPGWASTAIPTHRSPCPPAGCRWRRQRADGGRRQPQEPPAAGGLVNWGGIVRPVRLVPVGRAHLGEPATMSRVRCRGPARRCRAELLLDGVVEPGVRRIAPRLEPALRSPDGRELRRTFALPPQSAKRRRLWPLRACRRPSSGPRPPVGSTRRASRSASAAACRSSSVCRVAALGDRQPGTCI